MRPQAISRLVAFLFVSTTALGQGLERMYVVHNTCPGPINLFIGGQLDTAALPTRHAVSRVANVDAGFWYTDANGGRYNGEGTVRAGFWVVSCIIFQRFNIVDSVI